MKINGFQGEYRFLSNFYPGPVFWQGVIYPTAEHAYQASKTTDRQERYDMWFHETPGKAKRAGRKLKHIRKDWDEVKERIMSGIVFLRFAYSPGLTKKLLATGNAEIVEMNDWGDTFWGTHPNGEGENHLGKILMQVREDLRNGI